MKVKNVGNLFCLLGATTLAVAALPARAQTSPISDSLIVYDPNGGIYASVLATEADEIADPSRIYSISDTSLANLSQFGNATTLLEPDGSYSDIFGVYTDGNNNYFLGFSSDTEILGTPYGNQGNIFVPEGNGVFDATMYLSSDFQGRGYTAVFTSDTESVPDGGATGAMLGMAMMAIGWLRRKVS